MLDDVEYRNDVLNRWKELKRQRSSWLAHWREISQYTAPRMGRYMLSDVNKGYKKHQKIKDSTGSKVLKILGAGMMSGASSPARQWFKLGTDDPDLNEYRPMKEWNFEVWRRMSAVFAKSNTYRVLHSMYEEMGAFGTAANIILPRDDTVIHNYGLTVGEYCLDINQYGEVDCLYREFEKTVRTLVDQFGYSNCSHTVKRLFDRGLVDSYVPVIHFIEPRTDRDISKVDTQNMPYSNSYFETGSDNGKFLRNGGLPFFSAICPRWSLTLGDVYGHSPAMEALGDIVSLQHLQLRKSQGIDYQTKPPLQVPTSQKNRPLNTLPSGITYIDDPSRSIKTTFETRLDLSHLLEDIQDTRDRISSSFYADLFLMLANVNSSRMTATEVAERQEEKLLMLGAVIERVHDEMLQPLITTTFNYMLDAGLVPPAPQEAQGKNLKVEFISLLAQAQKAVTVNALDRYIQGVGMVAQAKPTILDKVDEDLWIDTYADALGVDPKLNRTDEAVAKIREARAKAEAAREKTELAENQSKVAKNLGVEAGDDAGVPSATTADVSSAEIAGLM